MPSFEDPTATARVEAGKQRTERPALAAAWRELDLLLLEMGLERCTLCGTARLVGELCVRPACRVVDYRSQVELLREQAEAWDCEENGHVTELGRRGCVECERRVALRDTTRAAARHLAEVGAHVYYAPEDGPDDRLALPPPSAGLPMRRWRG